MGRYDDKPFGVNSADGAEGDEGVAIKQSTKFDGDPDQDKKFEGLPPNPNTSAKQMQYSGRG